MPPPGTATPRNAWSSRIASDATAGNSYAAKRVEFTVAPKVHAHIECKQLIGAAPFTVAVSSKGSRPSRGKVKWGWEFYRPSPKRKPVAWKDLPHGAKTTHTFAKPGLYEVALTVKSGQKTDRETVQVWVTDGPPPAPVGGVVLEGNGVRIADGDDAPCAFDHTHFGSVREGERVRHRFVIFNRGDTELTRAGRGVAIAGPHAKEFRLVQAPAKRIQRLGSTPLEIEFRPKGAGPRNAEIAVQVGETTIRFQVAGNGAPR
jgi:hypothetical protein